MRRSAASRTDCNRRNVFIAKGIIKKMREADFGVRKAHDTARRAQLCEILQSRDITTKNATKRLLSRTRVASVSNTGKKEDICYRQMCF